MDLVYLSRFNAIFRTITSTGAITQESNYLVPRAEFLLDCHGITQGSDVNPLL